MATEWPQVLGSNRDGVAMETKIGAAWPEAGLDVAWQCKVGTGFAGPAVLGGTVFLFHRVKDKEIVEARAATDGKLLWQKEFATTYRGRIFPEHDGPLCTPLATAKHVFLFGAAGDLYCLKSATGELIWSRALYADYRDRFGQIDYGYFGAGAGPILADGKLFVNVGGREKAGIVALSPGTGKTLWKGTTEDASYSAPTLVKVGGVHHLIFVTRYHCLSLDPSNYRERFRFPFGNRGPTVNAATPLVVGDTLFVTASYGVGCVAAKVSEAEAKPLWSNDETMSSQYSTCVTRDGHLYGIHGRADLGAAHLRCVRLADGKLMWSEDDFGVGSVTLAGDRLLILKATGELLLVAAETAKYRQLAASRPFATTVRALPAIVGNRLYARDEAAFKCIELPTE